MSTQELDLTLAETIEFWDDIGGEDQIVVWLKELQRRRQIAGQCDDLVAALEHLRKAFLVAVGDKSPFAKIALAPADAALEKAKGGAV